MSDILIAETGVIETCVSNFGIEQLLRKKRKIGANNVFPLKNMCNRFILQMNLRVKFRCNA